MAKPDERALEREWAQANPRPYWTTEFWETCRPDFEEDDEQGA